MVDLQYLDQVAELFESENQLGLLHQAQLSSIQVANRNKLVEWICEVCEQPRFLFKTMELAVKYIGHYIQTYEILENYLQLLGITCLFVALKLMENRADIQAEEFLRNFGRQYSAQQLRELEMQLIKSLKWKLNVVTPSDYIIYLTGNCIVPTGFNDLLTYMIIDPKFLYVKSLYICATALKWLSIPINYDLHSDLHEVVGRLFQLYSRQISGEEPVTDDQQSSDGSTQDSQIESSDSEEDQNENLTPQPYSLRKRIRKGRY